MSFKPLERMFERIEAARSDSDTGLFLSLMIGGEMLLKLVVSGLLAAVAEDRSAGDIWVARRSGGPERVASDVVRFASLADCSAEPTGIYFDRSGKLLYVNVQHAGGALGNDLTVVITKQ